MVAHTGFGPVVSSLRGTRPRPLDECAAKKRQLYSIFNTQVHYNVFLRGLADNVQ